MASSESMVSVRAGLDPYLLWAIDTGFEYCEVESDATVRRAVHFVAELNTSARDLGNWLKKFRPKWLFIASEYLTSKVIEPEHCHFVTGYLSLDVLPWFTSPESTPGHIPPNGGEEFRKHIARLQITSNVKPLRPLLARRMIPIEVADIDLPSSNTSTVSDPMAERGDAPFSRDRSDDRTIDQTGSRSFFSTCTAVIDVAVPYAHADWRFWFLLMIGVPIPQFYPVPRLRAFWDQDSGLAMYPSNKDPYADGFPYGREWVEGTDPPLLKPGRVTELVDQVYSISDEEARYSAAGHKLALRSRSHGAATLGELCSSRLSSGGPGTVDDAGQLPVLAVQLPRPTLAHSSMGALSAHALDGMRWLIARAGKDSNLVVNVSLGTQGGPHDGSAMICSAFDELVHLRTDEGGHERLAVVLAAGNARDAQCHATVDLEPEHGFDLRMLVLPDSQVPVYLEIWSECVDLVVTLKSPVASLSATALPGTMASIKSSTGQVQRSAAAVINMGNDSALGRGNMALVAIGPTVGAVAEAGTWTITLQSPMGGSCDVYVERNNSMFDFSRPRGRQARLLDPAYERSGLKPGDVDDNSAAVIKRTGTLNSLATGKRTIVVGAFANSDDLSDRRAAPYSGAGPVRNGKSPPPDVASLGDQAILRRGVRVQGTRSGGFARVSGTSVAAPRVARRIANAMASGTKAKWKNWIQALATAENSGAPVDIQRVGYGMLRDGRIETRRDGRRFRK